MVGLSDGGSTAGAHLLAYASYTTDADVESELSALVEGFGAPFRGSEHQQVVLQAGIVRVHPQVFMSAEAAQQRWFQPGALTDFTQRHRSVLAFSAAALSWFRDPPLMPPGEGALWREGRGLLVVDVDLLRLSRALSLVWSVLPQALRPNPYGESSTVLEWDRAAGTFRSHEETRRRLRAETEAARDAFAQLHKLFPRQRYAFLLSELWDRARTRGTTPEQEAQEETRRGFDAIDMRSLLEQHFRTLGDEARREPSDPVGAVRGGIASASESLTRSVREALAAYLQDAILPGPRSQYETPQEVPESRLEKGSIGSTHDGGRGSIAGYPDAHAEQDFLDRIIGDEFFDRLRRLLTPAERDVLEHVFLEGEPVREYASRTGKKRGTVDAQSFSIRKKAKRLRNSS